MKLLASALGAFAALSFLVVTLTIAAQEKGEKKIDPPKKGAKAEPKKAEEKVVYGQKINGKINRIDNDSNHVFFARIVEPQRVASIQLWAQQQQIEIAKIKNPLDAARRVADYQQQYAQKMQNE